MTRQRSIIGWRIRIIGRYWFYFLILWFRFLCVCVCVYVFIKVTVPGIEPGTFGFFCNGKCTDQKTDQKVRRKGGGGSLISCQNPSLFFEGSSPLTFPSSHPKGPFFQFFLFKVGKSSPHAPPPLTAPAVSLNDGGGTLKNLLRRIWVFIF